MSQENYHLFVPFQTGDKQLRCLFKLSKPDLAQRFPQHPSVPTVTRCAVIPHPLPDTPGLPPEALPCVVQALW